MSFVCGPAFFCPVQFFGLLDAYVTDLWAAWGIKRLLSTWTGALIRVRRSSDNAEQDIGYAPSGAIDLAALLVFVGANSAYVTKVYDQLGNGRHLAQTTNGYQPRIVNAGVYDAAMVWDGNDDVLSSPASTPANVALSVAGSFNERTVPAFSAGSTLTQGMWNLSNRGVLGHNSFGYQYQANTGTHHGYLTTDVSGTTSEKFGANYGSTYTTLSIMDRGASGLSRFVIYQSGSAVTATLDVGGTSPGNFTTEALSIGGDAQYPTSQPCPMSGQWFAMWGTSQLASAAAISALA